MDFENFIAKINTTRTFVENLIQQLTNQTRQTSLQNFLYSFSKLSVFLTDNSNIQALENYENKAQKDTCPLDILCKDTLAKLNVIEPLLNNSTFDGFQPVQPRVPRQILPQATQVAAVAFQSLTTALKEIVEKKLLEGFDILKHLDGHNKTLIVLGSNGSGKTSFANYLKGLETHVRVIPAFKPLTVQNDVHQANISIADYNKQLYSQPIIQPTAMFVLITSICNEYIQQTINDRKDGQKNLTQYEKIKEIFDDFFEVKLDDSEVAKKTIKGTKNATVYEFNSMSDGERAAFFYIATVLVAPLQSFIVVDEPENHLNPAIYNKIWDRLIMERQDCQFIFISHTMEFINARSDFELVKIKNFVHPDKFEFDFLGDALDSLDSNFIVEIAGSRKPILFCEGSKTDFDYKVYEIVFGNQYTVIPTEDCISVQNSVTACNKHSTTFSIQQAIGIIDSDLKSGDEIASLKEKQIYALKCNEIEMLLLDEAIFKAALIQVGKDVNVFTAYKTDFFKKISTDKYHIIKRIVKTLIDGKLKTTFIDDSHNKTKEEISSNLRSIYESIDVDNIWQESETKINDIITSKNYDEAIKYCCLEHGAILRATTQKYIHDYASIALVALRVNPQLIATIKTKYFIDVP
jgi:energy-coupling factor transporter ATP-binding protein EcfA2